MPKDNPEAYQKIVEQAYNETANNQGPGMGNQQMPSLRPAEFNPRVPKPNGGVKHSDFKGRGEKH